MEPSATKSLNLRFSGLPQRLTDSSFLFLPGGFLSEVALVLLSLSLLFLVLSSSSKKSSSGFFHAMLLEILLCGGGGCGFLDQLANDGPSSMYVVSYVATFYVYNLNVKCCPKRKMLSQT